MPAGFRGRGPPGSLANDDRPDEDRPCLPARRGPAATLVPLVAAGGVGGPDDVADLLARGADLVQAGTAFLRCPESGAPAALKAALARVPLPATAVTRAFSGRRARALVNAMVSEHPGPGRLPRDQQRHATAPGRRPRRRHGHMSLYAGTGFRQAEAAPAADIVERLLSGVHR